MVILSFDLNSLVITLFGETRIFALFVWICRKNNFLAELRCRNYVSFAESLNVFWTWLSEKLYFFNFLLCWGVKRIIFSLKYAYFRSFLRFRPKFETKIFNFDQNLSFLILTNTVLGKNLIISLENEIGDF